MEVYKICGSCKGTGELTFHDIAGNPTREPITCPRCLGEKKILWGEIEDLDDKLDTLETKVDDIKEKVDEIKEVVDEL